VPGLATRVDVAAIQVDCPLLKPAQREQGSNVKDDAEIKQASESFLESMQQEFYLTGTKELFDKCNICIAVKGDYVE